MRGAVGRRGGVEGEKRGGEEEGIEKDFNNEASLQSSLIRHDYPPYYFAFI